MIILLLNLPLFNNKQNLGVIDKITLNYDDSIDKRNINDSISRKPTVLEMSILSIFLRLSYQLCFSVFQKVFIIKIMSSKILLLVLTNLNLEVNLVLCLLSVTIIRHAKKINV